MTPGAEVPYPLGDGRAWFDAAYDEAPTGAAVVRASAAGEGRVVLANPALAAVLGVPDEDLVGRDLLDFVDPGQVDDDRRAVAQFAAGSRRACARQKRFRRRDGTAVWGELRASRVGPPGEGASLVLVHVVDVTARHDAEEHSARWAATALAVTSLVTKVLGGAPTEEIYSLVVERVARLFDADSVSLVVLDPVSGRARVAAGTGPGNRKLEAELQSAQGVIGQLIRERTRVWSLPEPGSPAADEWSGVMGPVATARFGPERGAGLVAVGRPPGAVPFDQADAELLLGLGQQVALAIELEQARRDQEWLAVLEDRQRIARDLHDTVIQDLIAIGMQLDAGLAAAPDPASRARDVAVVDELEEIVRRLRGSVFDLRAAPRTQSLGEGALATAREAARVLGYSPTVRLEGYLEAVPRPLAAAVLAVLRDALSAVARYARARAVLVHLAADDREVRLVVEDDGCGSRWIAVPGEGREGAYDLARRLDGRVTVTARVPCGTRLTWACPVRGLPRPPRSPGGGRSGRGSASGSGGSGGQNGSSSTESIRFV